MAHRLQRGYALVLVLWVLALLTTMAMAFAGNVRLEGRAALSLTEQVRLGAAADGAVNQAIHRITRDRNAAASLANGAEYTLPWPDATLQITLRSESAKVDVNYAPRPLLAGLFKQVLADAPAEALADAVLDWRDRDDRRSPHGAEAADYRNAGLDVRPANSRFTSIDELALVMGMGPERLEKLRPHVTIHSRRPRIDPFSATAAVLAAVPGLDISMARHFIAYREARNSRGEPVVLDLLAAGMRYLERRPSLAAVNIQVLASNNGGRSLARTAVIRLEGRPGNYRLLDWQRHVTEVN